MVNTGIINYLKYFYPKLKTYAPFGFHWLLDISS